MSDDETRRTEEDEAVEGEEIAFEHLRLEVDGPVAFLTLARPDALNALHADLLLELGVAVQALQSDANVRALVLAGDGKAFCAGADLEELSQLSDPFAGREFALRGQDVMNDVAALPFPTVAALHGPALGGGLELALACDLRVAAPAARLGLPETTLGLIPGFGGSQRLPRLIGTARATDLVLTGRKVSAEEALSLGLVNRLAHDAVATAAELARAVAANAPVAVGLAKEALHRGADVTLPQGLEIEADLFGLATATRDAREGPRAFLEKRAPDYQGH